MTFCGSHTPALTFLLAGLLGFLLALGLSVLLVKMLGKVGFLINIGLVAILAVFMSSYITSHGC